MSQKRQHREEGPSSSFDDRRPRKTPSFKSVVLEVMNLCKFQKLMEPVLEPLIRRIVKEEVDTALRKYIISMQRNCENDTHESESRSLQLQFLNTISLPVFTGTRIEGEGGMSMEVALVDSVTGQVVASGLGSSAKVEVLVLEGDFDCDEKGNWTLEEFRNNMVREREGKKALLSGDVNLTLKDGRGLVGHVMFTDNSSWTRSRKFRLGARVFDDLGDVRVREARSEPFIVRDHRGELYKKHHPPSLTDEVWRLEKIGKDGAFHKRLRKERICTVQDFLMLFFLDPTRLRSILGTGMSAKMWEVTTEHARTCLLGNKLYSYGASQMNCVVFNVVWQVMGIFSNGQYVSSDKLSEAETANASELLKSALTDREKIVTFEDGTSPIVPTSSLQSSNLPSESDGFRHGDLISQKIIGQTNYLQHNASTPDYMQSVFDNCLQGIDTVGIRSDQPLDYSVQVPDGLIDPETMRGGFFSNEHLHEYFESDMQNDINDVFMTCPTSVNPLDKGKKGWNVLVSVIRWCCSIKRIVARKTHSGGSQRYCG